MSATNYTNIAIYKKASISTLHYRYVNVYNGGRNEVKSGMYIKKLAQLTGVSTRTLRYYDEIGLLVPIKDPQTQYRIYTQEHIDKLQQILFFKEFDMPLDVIKDIMHSPDFDQIEALLSHKELLKKKQQRIENLVKLIDRTINSFKGESTMTNEEKFELFKEKLIEENEEKYGEELREKYDEQTIMESYGKIKELTEEQYKAVQELEHNLFERLKEAMEDGDPSSSVAAEVAELHKRWLSFYWAKYTKEAHVGLAQMYSLDERFITYYDSRVGEGATAFLIAAIENYVSAK